MNREMPSAPTRRNQSNNHRSLSVKTREAPFRRPIRERPTCRNAGDARGIITVTVVLRGVDNSAVKGNRTKTLRVADATVSEVGAFLKLALFGSPDDPTANGPTRPQEPRRSVA
jgi:hypothetical protein